MTMAINYQDVIRQLEIEGLDVSGFQISTPKPVRCRVDGTRGRKGWYWLHEMPFGNGDIVIVGSFGVWHGSDNGARKIVLPEGTKPSKEENALIRKRIADNKRRMAAELKAKQAKAAKAALRKWNALGDEGESGYLSRKKVRASGVRFSRGAVAVPMRDVRGKLHGLQFILDKTNPAHKEKIKRMDSDKRFWPTGLAMQGHFHTIGKIDARGVNIITEGYATGDTLNDASGLAVAVCYSANNVLPVLEALARYYPKAKWLIAADDDYLCRCQHCKKQTLVAENDCAHCEKAHGKHNTGVTVAMKATMSVDAAEWIKPEFVDRGGKKLSDFNDLMMLEGLQVVADQVKQAVDAKFPALGLKAEPHAPAGAQQQGGGDDRFVSFMTVEEGLENGILIVDHANVIYFKRTNSIIPKSSFLDRLPDHAWREMKPQMQAVMMDKVGFDASETDRSIVCNMWQGWKTKPKEGCCDELLGLLRFLCSTEKDKSKELYHWVLKWLAYPVQHPGAKMKTSLVMRGPTRVGKNLFFDTVAHYVYGSTYAAMIGQQELEDKFNDWASHRLFVIGNEVMSGSELYHQKNKIKMYITDSSIPINRKNLPISFEKNQMNIALLTNESQPLALDHDDLRIALIDTPKRLSDDYYRTVAKERDDGGGEALHHYLLHVELGDFNPDTKPPATTAKDSLIRLSKDSSRRFYDDWTEGYLDLPVCSCLSSDLYDAYAYWCRKEGERYPRTHNQFSMEISRMDDIKLSPQKIFSGMRDALHDFKPYENDVMEKMRKPRVARIFGLPELCEDMPVHSIIGRRTELVCDFKDALRKFKGEEFQ